ncbi:hypothetical protein CY35_14G028700 [Sphagnum magellanicum]|nr:hypothetical protein CY35_14G028700 [Sphagnum magellanicum]
MTAGLRSSLLRSGLTTSEILCPVSTSTAVAIAEQPELRAYKLGKQKCSYNQVELVIKDIGSGRMSELKVSEAIETCVGTEVNEKLRESCLKFNVRFVNNNRMHMYIYIVYASPYGTTRSDKNTLMYHWMPVTRSKCRKNCKGPVIRGLQRFGRMPRRGASAVEGEDSWKEPRHLYIAIDEASTHVCPRHETSKFRLLVAAYDDKHHLLGTTVSSSIRVLANNDAPLGAASFKLHCNIRGNEFPDVLQCGWGGPGSTTSPLQSSRVQLLGAAVEKPVLSSRAPLQALIQNTSPSRSKPATTDNALKGDASPPMETTTSGPDLTVEHCQAREFEAKMLCTKIASSCTNQFRRVVLNKKMSFFLHQNLRVIEVANHISTKVPLSSRPTILEDLDNQKEHSLTQLCERILVECAPKADHAVISLRSLATVLGTRRRRIFEILSVLESVQVVQQQGNEKFIWLGGSGVSLALINLSCKVNIHQRPYEAMVHVVDGIIPQFLK